MFFDLCFMFYVLCFMFYVLCFMFYIFLVRVKIFILYIFTMSSTVLDPLLTPNDNRYVMFPIQYQDIWKMYKTQ